MDLYCHMIYSPETDKHSKTQFMITNSGINRLLHMTYTVIRTLCIRVLWCCIKPVPRVSLHPGDIYPPSLSDANCLSPPPPAPRAGPPHFPPPSRWSHFPQGPRASLSHCPLHKMLWIIVQYIADLPFSF
jgi:hypothetical protein